MQIDVEGDELNVLRGIEAQHWPSIRQLVVEVHNVHARLAGVVQLLRTTGQFRGEEIAIIPQSVSCEGGYLSYVPPEMHLYLVVAARCDSIPGTQA